MTKKPAKKRGHFQLTRGCLEHPVFGSKAYCERAAWASLIGMASFASHTIERDGYRIALVRGEVAVSIRDLCERWYWPQTSKVFRFLRKLERNAMISKNQVERQAERQNGTTTFVKSGTSLAKPPMVLTVLNYDVYQAPLPAAESKSGTTQTGEVEHLNGTTGGTTLYKDDKKGNNKGETPPPKAPGSYAFEGKIIRLEQDDLARWQTTYSNIRDWPATLQKADDCFASEPKGDPKKWFFRLSAWLKREHEALGKNQRRALPGSSDEQDYARRLLEKQIYG
jgi:hypothetical protein